MTRPLDETETVIGLAGDWHANSRWARHALHLLADQGVTTLCHLGDFGLLPGPHGRQYLSEVEGTCRGLGITIYVTPGNHEDYDQIQCAPNSADGLQWVTEHVALIPRGHRWTMGGRSCVSLGGAPSVDFPSRIEGKTWWPREMITENDVARVVAGGYADIMLAHDAPTPAAPAVERLIRDNPYEWTDRGRRYAQVGRDRMTQAFQGVQPAWFAHGHYHVRDEADVPLGTPGRRCRMLALNRDPMVGNLVVLNLADQAAADDQGSPGISHHWL